MVSTPSSGTGETKKDDAKAPTVRANRLAKETSPYLKQHAHNPVDWYPWGPEAYICLNFACLPPITAPPDLSAKLGRLAARQDLISPLGPPAAQEKPK